eukprot:gene4156-5920_t
MDIRQAAEERASQKEFERQISPVRPVSYRQRSYRRIPNTLPTVSLASDVGDKNNTPEIAKLVEIDYKWNGTRARAESGEFIVPRWVPDEEVFYCKKCNAEFDWANRKHHCRYCGFIFCDQCSSTRLLLPSQFGLRDPQRVCIVCSEFLIPQQAFLSNNIANHQCVNTIDIATSQCNMRRYLNFPVAFSMNYEIQKAAYTVYNLFILEYFRDKAIPLRLLANAKGLAFLTVIKGGFIFAPRIGTGLVIAKLPNGSWSAPSAIGTIGLSWGAVIGMDVTDYVIILNTDEAVTAFSGYGQVSIGAGVEVAVGPIGRSGSVDLHVSDTGLAPAYSYSHSRGMFVGLTLDGSILMARTEVNHNFYGRQFTPLEILRGVIPPPRAAASLYSALADALASGPDPQHYKQPKVLRTLPNSSITTNETVANLPKEMTQANYNSSSTAQRPFSVDYRSTQSKQFVDSRPISFDARHDFSKPNPVDSEQEFVTSPPLNEPLDNNQINIVPNVALSPTPQFHNVYNKTSQNHLCEEFNAENPAYNFRKSSNEPK